jgi:putative transposase
MIGDPHGWTAWRATLLVRATDEILGTHKVTDRILIFGAQHLQTILAEYEAHYNGRRPHRSRQLRPPRPDHPVADLSQERIKRRPVLGGLSNEYERAA